MVGEIWAQITQPITAQPVRDLLVQVRIGFDGVPMMGVVGAG